jgi:hypothetical protein
VAFGQVVAKGESLTLLPADIPVGVEFGLVGRVTALPFEPFTISFGYAEDQKAEFQPLSFGLSSLYMWGGSSAVRRVGPPILPLEGAPVELEPNESMMVSRSAVCAQAGTGAPPGDLRRRHPHRGRRGVGTKRSPPANQQLAWKSPQTTLQVQSRLEELSTLSRVVPVTKQSGSALLPETLLKSAVPTSTSARICKEASLRLR